MINDKLLNELKEEKQVAKIIRIILVNSGFKQGEKIKYQSIKEIFNSYANKKIFDKFKDKYGDDKNDKNIDEYIRHSFQGVVHIEDKKSKPLITTNNNKNGEYTIYPNNYTGLKVNKSKGKKEGCGMLNLIEKLEQEIKNGNYQIIFTGAPGTGKTYNVKKYVEEHTESKEQYRFVQFHMSYDYSDFVEGLRPAVIEGQDNNSFVRLDGIFKEFCRHIVEENSKTSNYDTSKNYYFIIDEINRTDLSKVFGELMYGLEEDYRGEENAFDTQYKNLPVYKINDEGKAVLIENDCFKDGFYVPENLIIIGTMNDIDRSVETFDFALRRRFRWVEINAYDVMEHALKEMRKGDSEEDIKDLIDSANAMNVAISSNTKIGLNKSFHIGPAYFKKGTKENIWDTKVQPILFEYCRGRKSDDTDKFIKDCRQAFFSRKSSENNETNSEEN